MRILRLDIQGFRGIAELQDWRPRPGMNCLVGPMNSGKSTILEALRLLLGPEPVSEDQLSRLDMYGVTMVPGAAIRLGASLHLTGDEWRNFALLEEPRDLGAVPWDTDAAGGDLLAADADGVMLRVAFFYQWDREDPEDRAVAFFPKCGPPGSPDCVPLTVKHRRALGLWLAPADDPLWRTSTFARSSQLSRAARALGWDPMGRDGIPQFIEGLVDQTHHLSNNWGAVAQLSERIRDGMSDLVPSLPGEAQLGVTAGLTNAWALRMLELALGEGNGHARVPVSRQGTGFQRALAVAAQRACASIRATEGDLPGSEILAIDEPEVGLHPQAQRALVAALCIPVTPDENDGVAQPLPPQAFIATHSPSVTEEAGPRGTWVLANSAGHLQVTDLQVADGERAGEQLLRNAERYWQTLAGSLFTSLVLVVEGCTEQAAITAFDRWWVQNHPNANFRGLNAHGIGVVNADGIENIAPLSRVLCAMGVTTIALHDYDVSSPPQDEARRQDIQTAARLVVMMPVRDAGTDFEMLMASGTNALALSELLTHWEALYVPSDGQTFEAWLRSGLTEGLRASLPADGPDGGSLRDQIVALRNGPDHQQQVVDWLAQTCRGGIFGKSARYARIWADALIANGSVPVGIARMFDELGRALPQLTANRDYRHVWDVPMGGTGNGDPG